MANIRTFDTPALSLRPSETGVESAAGAARRVGAFYNQEASATEQLGSLEGSLLSQTGNRFGSAVQAAGDQYVAYEDHKEISQGAAVASDMFVNLEKQWNDTVKNSDPNDPSVAAKFKETVLQPSLDQFSENFTTENSQKYAEGIVDRYRQHFAVKTAADMSTMAGIAAKENAAKTINGLSSAVYMDPTSLDTAIDTLQHSAGHIVDSSPTIDAETGARVKAELNQKGVESLVKSAVSGMIEKNPNVDLDAIQRKYGDYINGGELKMFQKAAQVQAKADLVQSKQLETYQRQQQERAANDAFTKSRTDNITADDNGNLTVNPKIIKDALDITRKYPQAGTGPLDTTIRFVESQHDKAEKPQDDPLVKSDLMTRMFSADKPTTTLDLMKARAEGKISDHTFQAYHGLVQELEQSPLKGPVWEDTIGAVKSELILSGVGLPGKDVPGEANYAKWAQTFIPQYLEKSRAGTLPPNALDVKDPNSMISQSMAPFKRTVQQRAQDYLSVLKGGDAGSAPSAPVRKFGDVPVPAALGGIAALQYNKSAKQWRDSTSGIIYDSAGQPVVAR